jgi:hypothetical protein
MMAPLAAKAIVAANTPNTMPDGGKRNSDAMGWKRGRALSTRTKKLSRRTKLPGQQVRSVDLGSVSLVLQQLSSKGFNRADVADCLLCLQTVTQSYKFQVNAREGQTREVGQEYLRLWWQQPERPAEPLPCSSRTFQTSPQR